MADVTPLQELIERFGRTETLGIPLVEELRRLSAILPHDVEMAAVRGRRIVDLIVRALYNRKVGAAGTRPLEQLLPDLEKQHVMTREVVAHIRSLKEVANLCAHEGGVDPVGLEVCLIDLVVVLKWFARQLETAASSAPVFRTLDGVDVEGRSTEVIEQILGIDSSVFGDGGDEEDFGSFPRSASWYEQNPHIYTLLFCGPRLIGYSNVMPLEDEAWSLALKGELHDGLVEADMIRRYALPGLYRVYVCCVAVLPEFRRHPGAFGALYDSLFEKFLHLADSEIYISEISANAWTPEGRSLCRTFGMAHVGNHVRHGEVYHCTVIPPGTTNPSRKLRLLLNRYTEVGLLPGP